MILDGSGSCLDRFQSSFTAESMLVATDRLFIFQHVRGPQDLLDVLLASKIQNVSFFDRFISNVSNSCVKDLKRLLKEAF